MSNLTRPGSAEERHTMPEASRRGAHRARANPLLGVLPVVAVGALVVLVIAMAYFLFGRSLTSGDSTPPLARASVSPTGGPSAGDGTSPSADAGAEPSGQAEPSGSASGKVDKTITLNFFNGSQPQVKGLSRKAGAIAKAKGWTIGAYQPWSGEQVSATTVFYASAEQKATALAVVKLLGVGEAKLSPQDAGDGIAVVVFNDFTP